MALPRPSASPARPGACVCERERLEAPGADRRILLPDPPGRAAPGRPPGSPAAWKTTEHLRRMEEQLGIRLRIAPAFGECAACAASACASRSSRGSAARPARRFPPPSAAALEKRPEVAYALLNAHDLLRDA